MLEKVQKLSSARCKKRCSEESFPCTIIFMEPSSWSLQSTDMYACMCRELKKKTRKVFTTYALLQHRTHTSDQSKSLMSQLSSRSSSSWAKSNPLLSLAVVPFVRTAIGCIFDTCHCEEQRNPIGQP